VHDVIVADRTIYTIHSRRRSPEECRSDRRRPCPDRTSWKKGQSGNPGGRPKVAAEVKELARQHGVEAIETLIRLMHSKNEAVAIRAAEALLARRSGNPAQESDVENERPLQIIITDAPSPSTPAASVASERKKPSPEVIIT